LHLSVSLSILSRSRVTSLSLSSARPRHHFCPSLFVHYGTSAPPFLSLSIRTVSVEVYCQAHLVGSPLSHNRPHVRATISVSLSQSSAFGQCPLKCTVNHVRATICISLYSHLSLSLFPRRYSFLSTGPRRFFYSLPASGVVLAG